MATRSQKCNTAVRMRCIFGRGQAFFFNRVVTTLRVQVASSRESRVRAPPEGCHCVGHLTQRLRQLRLMLSSQLIAIQMNQRWSRAATTRKEEESVPYTTRALFSFVSRFVESA